MCVCVCVCAGGGGEEGGCKVEICSVPVPAMRNCPVSVRRISVSAVRVFAWDGCLVYSADSIQKETLAHVGICKPLF